MRIDEIRILPPLAIARLGSSDNPLENYELVVSDPLGHRQIRAAETLRVDPTTGEIAEAYQPEVPIKFRDGTRIRPVAPFLELFARTGETLVPLTTNLLASEGASPGDIEWTVTVGNIKAFRRTNKEQDKIIATATFHDHATRPLEGRCENFLDGKTLPLGSVRYIKPNKEFPEVRLRYTPAHGLVYGAAKRRIIGENANGPIYESRTTKLCRVGSSTTLPSQTLSGSAISIKGSPRRPTPEQFTPAIRMIRAIRSRPSSVRA